MRQSKNLIIQSAQFIVLTIVIIVYFLGYFWRGSVLI
ncbi:MAG: DUF3149 domain-containing protein [Sulfurimonas sp.]